MLKKVISLAVFLSLTVTVPIQVQAVTSVSSEYMIGENDILQVVVLQPDKLDVEVTVSPDGSMTFPYIGAIFVKGATLTEVQEKIRVGLSDYMKYPVVSVSLKEARSRTFYVYGEVEKPGAFILEKNTSVVQAISTAGGFTPVASTNSVKILRRNADNTGSTVMTADVEAIVTGKKPDDITIEPGDVVTVVKRFF